MVDSGTPIGSGNYDTSSYTNYSSSSGGGSGSKPLKILFFILKIPIFPLVMIYNLIRTGKFFPNYEGKITAVIFSILIFAAIILAAVPIFAPIGFSGIAAGVSNFFGIARDTAEQATGSYVQQVQQAMGLSYASEIDQYASQDIGLSMVDVGPSQQVYSRTDSVSIWGRIEGKSSSSERAMLVDLECWQEKQTARGRERLDGRITPRSEFTIDSLTSNDFRCEFPQGVLAEESTAPDLFKVRSNFDFSTRAYIPTIFMDYDAFYALERVEPERVLQLRSQPVSKNTYAPVALGIGIQNSPILITRDSMQNNPTFGFSITNNWNGFVNNITAFNVMVPTGIILEDCDAMTQLVKVSSDEFYTNYSLSEEGVAYLSSRITANDLGRRFVPQSFKCFIYFDTDKIYEGRNRLDPISLNIFADIEYNYAFEKEFYIPIAAENDRVSVSFSPSIIGLNSAPEFSITEVGLNRNLLDARVTVRYRPRDDLISTDVESLRNRQLTKDASGAFVGNIGKSEGRTLEQIIPSLSRGDTLIFEFNVILSNGENYKALRAIRILNNPPEVERIYFEPSNPVHGDNLICNVEVSDKDGDDIESATFVFTNQIRNLQIEVEGECTEEDSKWVCYAEVNGIDIEENDYVECTVTLFDGVDYNRFAARKEIRILPYQDALEYEDETIMCESTDGLDIQVHGTTRGLNEDGVYVEMRDRCENSNTLIEYYCAGNVVTYHTYDCDCRDGVCV